MNILNDLNSLLFVCHTFGVRRTIDVLVSETKIYIPELRGTFNRLLLRTVGVKSSMTAVVGVNTSPTDIRPSTTVAVGVLTSKLADFRSRLGDFPLGLGSGVIISS